MTNTVEIRRQAIVVFADYHQFYVQDGGVNPPAPEDWNDQDVANRAKVAEHIVVVCPVRDMPVPVEIALFRSEPPFSGASWDHVVESSLSLPTGHLQVHECTGGAVLDWQVEPGVYEVRLLYSGLDTLSPDGLQGEDSYAIELWPGKPRALSVVRAWRGEL